MAEDTKFAFIDGYFVNRVSGEKIPQDEPVILFRARDIHALQVLKYYESLIADSHHRAAVLAKIGYFRAFRNNHPDRMKEPGITGDIEITHEQDEHEKLSLKHDRAIKVLQTIAAMSEGFGPVMAQEFLDSISSENVAITESAQT